MRRLDKHTWGYFAALAGCFLLSVVVGWTDLGAQLDNDAYDWMFRRHPVSAAKTHSVLLAFDDRTLNLTGGMRNLRPTLAAGLEQVALAGPRAVAVDITLAEGDEESVDARLEAVFQRLPNLVLPCDLIPSGWQDPIPRFRKPAAAVGHVHAGPDQLDSVTRQIPLRKVAGHDRRWALALEAFRLSRGGGPVIESPDEIQVAGTLIPVGLDPVAPLRVRYLQPDADGNSQIPVITFQDLRERPELAQGFAGRVVFVGVVSRTAANDRLMTPLSNGQIIPGVEIHAQAFETLARGRFLVSAPISNLLAFCAVLVALAGVTFAYLSGWKAYTLGGLLLLVAHAFPYWQFGRDVVYPYFVPATAAWLSVVMAASYQYFVVRRQLKESEMEKARYQQAIHFVTHEMRTPLTAIQGSSELMTRYTLNDEKRKQIAQMINSESKRLARMIQTFLDVERLTDGQLELKKVDFPALDMLATCVERARPLADRKQIRLEQGQLDEALLSGDRELMEYAYYNLITNAIKYSPAETTVTLSSRIDGDRVRLAVQDQGIGIDEKEVKNVFRKFYRTKKAEASGEVGTGIGLSIVEQIVTHHGGGIEVSSQPGKGSCFTLVLPATR